MAVEKSVTISISAEDKTAAGFNSTMQRLKELRREETRSGEAILKRTIAGGPGAMVEAAADMLGAGMAVFAIDQVGRALNSTVDKVREIRREMRETGATAGEMADKLAGTLPVYGQLWQAGRKIREDLDGTADAVAAITNETAALNAMEAVRKQSAEKYSESLEKTLAIVSKIRQEMAMFGQSPGALAFLQVGNNAATNKAAIDKQEEAAIAEQQALRAKALEAYKKEKEAAQQQLEQMEKGPGGGGFLDVATQGMLASKGMASGDAEKRRKQLEAQREIVKNMKEEDYTKEIDEKIKGIRESAKKAREEAAKAPAAQNPELRIKQGREMAAAVLEVAEMTRRAEAEADIKIKRARGQDEEADIAQLREDARRQAVERKKASDLKAKAVEAYQDPKTQNRLSMELDAQNAEAERALNAELEAVRARYAEKRRRESTEQGNKEQAMASEVRARALDAEGRHLDAELERIRAHYAQRVAVAETASEKELLARLQAADEAAAADRTRTTSGGVFRLQAIQSASLGRELSGLRERLESSGDPNTGIYGRIANASEKTNTMLAELTQAVRSGLVMKGRRLA
jgi:hypothetical protein